MFRLSVIATLVLTLAACAHMPPPSSTSPAAAATGTTDPAAELVQFFETYWQASLKLNPLGATFVGDNRYNHLLPNSFGAEFRAQEENFQRDWLARANAIDTAPLNAQDRLSLTIFKRDLQSDIEGARFPGHLIPLNQFYSFPNLMAQLGSGTSAQPFKTVQDYDHWLQRAAQIPALLDQMIANMREGMQAGVVQPRVLMEKVIPQLDALIVADPAQTLFYRPVAAMPERFPEADRPRLRAAYLTLIRDQLMPAYARLRDFVRDEYLPSTRETVGLDALPGGADWYAYNVRRITTTDLTPAQIHRIGLDEVARIHAQMRKVIRELGYAGGLQDFFTFLTTDPRFKWQSEEQLLADYNALRERVELGASKLFSTTPKAAFEIRPVEAFRAKSAAGGSYMRPSEDGSRPGIFYVNTYDLPSRKTWDMEDLFLHEAIPGHHFQLALQQELQGIPAFRRFGSFTAFIEGWGLYAESLGKEIGVYTDPYQYFGFLQNELWRAIRLVVDTGLHSKHWTRQQVIDYMLANSAESQTQAIAEAERYMAIPGQALAYKLGELKFRELRTRAERELGPRFDIKAFHAEVLKDGAVPLDVLEDKVVSWIAAQKS
jgi:uncharacterized protein (DUF885 family)